MIKKAIPYLVLFCSISSCELSGNKNLADIGFLSFLFRLPSEKTCSKYPKVVNTASSNGTTNSYTCTYTPETVSMDCTYTTAITEDNLSVTSKKNFYKSTDDLINKSKTFALASIRYSQINNNVASNKFFEYNSLDRLTRIIQSDNQVLSISEYDDLGRYTKGTVSLSNGICTVPFTTSYDDINFSFKTTVLFSQTSPSTNMLCAFFATNVSDQISESFFDSNHFLVKKVITSGTTVTTENFTTSEIAELCTGSDGVAYSAPIIQKFNSSGAAVGETASLTGINFDTDASGNSIQFANGVTTNASSATDSTLSFVVPSGAISGQLTITNRFGVGVSQKAFNVYKYFLYVANNSSNSISSFQVDIADGSLISPNTIGSVGNQPRSLVAHPNGKFLYLCSIGILAVNVYNINPNTGALSFSSTVNAGNGARTVVIDSTGTFLFVLNNTDMTISRFSIDQTNGSLTSLGAALNVGVSNLYWMATHPTLPLLFVSRNGSNSIYYYLIGSTGNLISLAGSPLAFSSNPFGITVHPSGKFLYTATSAGSGAISKFLINELTGVPSSEVFYPIPYVMESIAFDSTGNYGFACSNANNSIDSATVNQSDGALNGVTNLPSNQCRTVLVDPSNRYVYTTEDVPAAGGKINKYKIGSGGTISSLGSIPLGTNNPQGMTFAKSPQ